MSRESSHEQIAPTPLDDDTIIYRAAFSRSWLSDDKRRATDLAFHRRPPDHPSPDLDGLSFGLTPQDAVSGLSRPVPGIIRLRVGDLRALRVEIAPGKELNVFQDRAGHAVIDNLPFYDESDFEQLREAIRWAEIIPAITEVRPEEQLPKSYWKER